MQREAERVRTLHHQRGGFKTSALSGNLGLDQAEGSSRQLHGVHSLRLFRMERMYRRQREMK